MARSLSLWVLTISVLFAGAIQLQCILAMLHEDLIDVMPAVEEANSISEELDKRVKFEIILIAPNMLGKLKHKHEGFEDRDKTSSQPEVSSKFFRYSL